MTSSVEVQQAFSQARAAFQEWKQKSVNERLPYAAALRRLIMERLDEVVSIICASTGKVDADTINSDILPTLEIIRYYEKRAEHALRRRKRKTPFLFYKNYSYIEYKPLGVVLIISPWNCPFQLSLVPAVTALLAGNAVILKPATVTSDVGKLIDDLCKDAGFPQHVMQVIFGGREIGGELISAGPDKILFTGSVATGKSIMEMASQDLIPVVLELGGKDPMIVFEDADLEKAADAAVYGAFASSGQLCVSVERLYVQSSIYQAFATRVAERTKRLRVGKGADFDLGPMIASSQIDVIEAQITDAVSKGAQLLTEVRREGNFLYPVVMRDVNHTMKLMQEETFGPVLPILPFTSEEEAITLANDSRYGLNASVWSGNEERAKRVVSRLETGNAYINDVIKNIGNPELPFGGVKQSGFGKYHGPEGLYTFSMETSVMVNRYTAKREINWFPFNQELVETLKNLLRLLYGKIALSEKLRIFMSMRSLVRK